MGLTQSWLTLDHSGKIEPHCIAVRDRPGPTVWRRKLSAYNDSCGKLFANLANKTGFGRFTVLHLAAWKLPHAGQLRWAGPAGGEHLGGGFE